MEQLLGNAGSRTKSRTSNGVRAFKRESFSLAIASNVSWSCSSFEIGSCASTYAMTAPSFVESRFLPIQRAVERLCEGDQAGALLRGRRVLPLVTKAAHDLVAVDPPLRAGPRIAESILERRASS